MSHVAFIGSLDFDKESGENHLYIITCAPGQPIINEHFLSFNFEPHGQTSLRDSLLIDSPDEDRKEKILPSCGLSLKGIKSSQRIFYAPPTPLPSYRKTPMDRDR